MTDLEMTKLCAEAMGLRLLPAYPEGHILRTVRNVDETNGLMVSRDGDRAYHFVEDGAYDPLTNDAQCFALVKRFRLFNLEPWVVAASYGMQLTDIDADLNRAVCECVATLHHESSKPVALRTSARKNETT
jgi:hypothetical protein